MEQRKRRRIGAVVDVDGEMDDQDGGGDGDGRNGVVTIENGMSLIRASEDSSREEWTAYH